MTERNRTKLIDMCDCVCSHNLHRIKQICIMKTQLNGPQMIHQTATLFINDFQSLLSHLCVPGWHNLLSWINNTLLSIVCFLEANLLQMVLYVLYLRRQVVLFMLVMMNNWKPIVTYVYTYSENQVSISWIALELVCTWPMNKYYNNYRKCCDWGSFC